jgi:hypothetical protein
LKLDVHDVQWFTHTLFELEVAFNWEVTSESVARRLSTVGKRASRFEGESSFLIKVNLALN